TPSLVLFTPDGKYLLSNGGAGLRVWDVEAGTELLRERLDGREVRTLALSPDGKLVAAGDQAEGFYLWKWDSGKEPRKIKPGNRGGSNWGGGVHLWDTTTGKHVRTLATPGEGISKVAFSRDGRWLAGSGTNLHVWDMRSGKEVLAGEPGHRGRISQIATSATG